MVEVALRTRGQRIRTIGHGVRPRAHLTLGRDDEMEPPRHEQHGRGGKGGHTWRRRRTDRPRRRPTARSRPRTGRCGRWATTIDLRRARSGSSARCSSRPAGSRLVSACSTWRRARGTRPSGRRGRGPGWWRRTSRPSTSKRDAAALPFADGEFDVVTSSLGAIFAPNHREVADQLLRVCRPGGTIGMINFTPEGLGADFFGVFTPYMPPPPPGALPPVMWGSEGHVRELFGDRVEDLQMTRQEYVETAESPRAYLQLFKETFGPAIAIYEGLVGRPEQAALDRAFLDFVTRANCGADGGPARYSYEYLLVVARKRRG